MEFTSDGAIWGAPEILDRLSRERSTSTPLFDEDEISTSLRHRIADLFDCEVDVFPVMSGSAANAIALSTVTPPYGAVLCHWDAHIQTDECGAAEMFTGGAKLIGIAGDHGKIDAHAFKSFLSNARFGVTHSVQPKALSLTQANEAGTVYSLAELARLTELAKGVGLKVHMDGARLANAIAVLGCKPADVTWKAGVDILCLGATKNGAIAAEAIIVFDRLLSETLRYMRKRSGHFIAKTRFLSLQLDTYLSDELWLRNARHANALARRLIEIFKRVADIEFVHPPESNELFITMPDALLHHLQASGVRLYVDWRTTPLRHHRMVTSFATTPEEIETVAQLVEDWSVQGNAAYQRRPASIEHSR